MQRRGQGLARGKQGDPATYSKVIPVGEIEAGVAVGAAENDGYSVESSDYDGVPSGTKGANPEICPIEP